MFFFFSYKSHCLFSQHIFTITLAFTSAVEFSFLFLVIKIKKFILRFFLFINHSVYSPSYFHLHISLLWCCGVFLFVFLVKEKNSFKDFFLFFLIKDTVYSLYIFLPPKDKCWLGGLEFSSLCSSKRKKEKKSF